MPEDTKIADISTEDEQSFREKVLDFLEKNCDRVGESESSLEDDPERVAECRNFQQKLFDGGLAALSYSEKFGGAGLTKKHQEIFDQVARDWRLPNGPLYISHGMCLPMLDQYGTEEQKNEFLPKLATGELRTGVGLTEPDAGTDLQGIKTKAVLDGDHYIVNGSKMWITNGRYANPLPVLVKTDTKAEPAHKGMSVLLMDQNAEGFEISKDIGKLGYKGPESCLIMFSDVKVHKSMLLGEVEGRGLQQVLSALEIGRLNIAARAVGIAQESYNQALAYSKERKAFGKEINEFQAIQLKLAELATNVQASRLLTWWSASMADQGKRVDTEAGMAKYFSSEVAIANSLDAMRIHGGMGYSTEYSIERLYRDAPLMAIGEGTNDIMKTIIAKGLVKGDVVID